MDPQVQTSFIPKRSLDVSARNSGSSFGLLFLIGLLVFIASIVAAGASFVYTQYLTKSIADKSHSLALAEGAYDPGAIQDLLRMDNRLTQSEKLLASHVAVSGIFALLSTQTLQKVSFTNFEYVLDPDGTAKITMQGSADSFSTVALQSDQFGSNKLFKNIVFSGISVDTTGRVGFSVSATIDPSVISYSNSLGGVTQTPSVPAPSIPAPSLPTGTTTPPTQ